MVLNRKVKILRGGVHEKRVSLSLSVSLKPFAQAAVAHVMLLLQSCFSSIISVFTIL